jgi:ketosteroid isomerase-like protein
MSQENVALARRGYAALNAAYESGEVNDLLPILDEIWEPDVVLKGTGSVLAGGEEWHGHEGMLRFTASQMEAFQQMSLEPLEFIDAGDQLVVPVRFGGRARYTGIEVEFRATHVFTIHDGKVTRMDIYESKAEALEAVGLLRE